MHKPKKQNKPLNDLSRSLTTLDPNQTLIAVIDNASSYCIPFYVIRIPGFFDRDLLLADGVVLLESKSGDSMASAAGIAAPSSKHQLSLL